MTVGFELKQSDRIVGIYEYFNGKPNQKKRGIGDC